MSRELEELREKVDEADRQLLEILSARMRIIEEIGALKRAQHLDVVDVERWQNILQSRLSWASTLRLSPTLVGDIFQSIHKHAIEIEKQ